MAAGTWCRGSIETLSLNKRRIDLRRYCTCSKRQQRIDSVSRWRRIFRPIVVVVVDALFVMVTSVNVGLLVLNRQPNACHVEHCWVPVDEHPVLERPHSTPWYPLRYVALRCKAH